MGIKLQFPNSELLSNILQKETNLQKQLKNRCIKLGKITAKAGERPLTCPMIALKMNPTAFMVPLVTKFDANPAIVTIILG